MRPLPLGPILPCLSLEERMCRFGGRCRLPLLRPFLLGGSEKKLIRGGWRVGRLGGPSLPLTSPPHRSDASAWGRPLWVLMTLGLGCLPPPHLYLTRWY